MPFLPNGGVLRPESEPHVVFSSARMRYLLTDNNVNRARGGEASDARSGAPRFLLLSLRSAGLQSLTSAPSLGDGLPRRLGARA
jgi:hypothetical protein